MVRDRRDNPIDKQKQCSPLCWRELLQSAFSGIYPSDQQLERMMDHLERTP